MKYCNDCKRFSPEQHLFCTTCGSSFGVKLCQPHQHPNPRNAAYCHTCGTRQFSRPHQPRIPSRRSRLLVLGLVSAAFALILAVPVFLLTPVSSPLGTVIVVAGLFFLVILSGAGRKT